MKFWVGIFHTWILDANQIQNPACWDKGKIKKNLARKRRGCIQDRSKSRVRKKGADEMLAILSWSEHILPSRPHTSCPGAVSLNLSILQYLERVRSAHTNFLPADYSGACFSFSQLFFSISLLVRSKAPSTCQRFDGYSQISPTGSQYL